MLTEAGIITAIDTLDNVTINMSNDIIENNFVVNNKDGRKYIVAPKELLCYKTSINTYNFLKIKKIKYDVGVAEIKAVLIIMKDYVIEPIIPNTVVYVPTKEIVGGEIYGIPKNAPAPLNPEKFNDLQNILYNEAIKSGKEDAKVDAAKNNHYATMYTSMTKENLDKHTDIFYYGKYIGYNDYVKENPIEKI